MNEKTQWIENRKIESLSLNWLDAHDYRIGVPRLPKTKEVAHDQKAQGWVGIYKRPERQYN